MNKLNTLKALCFILPSVATLAFNPVQPVPVTTVPVASEVPAPSWPPIGWPSGSLTQHPRADLAPTPLLTSTDTPTSWPPIGWCSGGVLCTTTNG